MLERVRLWWHALSVRRKMDRVFRRGEDPYRYADSPYEVGRLAAMAEALGGRRYGRVLEVGSAEGSFTARLAELADRVTAIEISPVALGRARGALAGAPGVVFVEADVRTWSPPSGERFDAVVLADVLYYMDKPLVRDQFDALFPRLAGWVAEGGLILLAHAFASDAERSLRASYRERFEAQGLALESEIVVGKWEKDGDVRCLISVLRRSQPGSAIMGLENSE